MNSRSTPLGGSIKTATRFEMPLRTRSAASSAPAPSESSDKTMMSAGATGLFTTSAHPAARRTGTRRERTATIVSADNTSAPRMRGPHLDHLKITLRLLNPPATAVEPTNCGAVASMLLAIGRPASYPGPESRPQCGRGPPSRIMTLCSWKLRRPLSVLLLTITAKPAGVGRPWSRVCSS